MKKANLALVSGILMLITACSQERGSEEHITITVEKPGQTPSVSTTAAPEATHQPKASTRPHYKFKDQDAQPTTTAETPAPAAAAVAPSPKPEAEPTPKPTAAPSPKPSPKPSPSAAPKPTPSPLDKTQAAPSHDGQESAAPRNNTDTRFINVAGRLNKDIYGETEINSYWQTIKGKTVTWMGIVRKIKQDGSDLSIMVYNPRVNSDMFNIVLKGNFTEKDIAALAEGQPVRFTGKIENFRPGTNNRSAIVVLTETSLFEMKRR
ncbi:MAG: hypothetical protein HQL01_03935 [Nitrospirae bacterium]|nr:hypothetical protein [Nitrospirota bacterium]